MTNVMTVLGSVNVNDLGFTLMHEHILNTSAGIPHAFPELVNREDAIVRGIEVMKNAAAEGVKSCVDVTTMDLGRDMIVIREVAERSEVNIIVCTGIWRDIPRAIGIGVTPDQLARAFIRDIEVGIENTGVKAGIIKVATDLEHMTDDGLIPANELVLRAAARASNHTGVPISTHTAAPARAGDRQVEIFQDEGVPLNRVYIGHSNDTDNIDYLTGLLGKGCFVGMDRYPGGRNGGLNWEQRTEVVKQLVDLGFSGQVTMSHDCVINGLNLPEREVERRAYNPDDISFISRNVLPRLRDLGVTDEQINSMMVDVPRRVFGGE